MKNLSHSVTIAQILSVALVFLSCGLFMTDKPEDPVGSKIVDPLSFKSILKGTVEQFDFEDYNYLFHSDFGYYDPINIQYSRDRLLSRIGIIESEYIGDGEPDTIKVVWFKADTTGSDPVWFDKQKEITLQTRGYFVLTGDSLVLTDTIASGEATFKLRYDNTLNNWVISYWRDIPKNGAIKSFFHPEY